MGKLPQITIAFWVMKICATTLGETAGDLLSMTLNVGYAASSIILVAIFLAAVSLQLRAKRYLPPLYWLVILATSTAGTTMSDYMDRTLHLGYETGAAILLALLAAVFLLWRLSGQPLAVEKIRSVKVELLYWTAILFSNTLGTALGDFLSEDSGLGFLGGAALIGGLLVLTGGAYYATRASRTALFWIAFVLTRPFGAELGDLLTKSREKGGFGLGTAGSSAVLAAVLFMFVAQVTWSRRSVARAPGSK